MKNKWNGERREISINGTLKSLFQGITRHLNVPYVFRNDGKQYGDIKRSFHTALRRSKIQDFRFHDLRHTFASQLVMAGIDLTTVKELLDHKTFTMTLRYAHLAPSYKVKAVEILDCTIITLTAQLQYSIMTLTFTDGNVLLYKRLGL